MTFSYKHGFKYKHYSNYKNHFILIKIHFNVVRVLRHLSFHFIIRTSIITLNRLIKKIMKGFKQSKDDANVGFTFVSLFTEVIVN